MIEARGLTKKYGGFVAINGLSFTAAEGEVIGLLGPNGAGKTTTLNILTGYLNATGGTVIINGIDISEEPEKAKACIGYLPDVPPLYPEMTVMEYLKFAAELKGVQTAEVKTAAVAHVLKLAKIEDVQNKLIKTLSKGYKQRVGLAQAIIGSPKIIILDEPASGLDPKQIIEMRDIIKALGKEHTVILSSHILHEVSAVCDRVIIINKGKTVASGTMEELSETVLAGNKIIVKVKGSSEKEIVSAFSEIKGVSLTVSEAADNGSFDVVFTGSSDQPLTLCEEIFNLAVKNGLTLLELTPVTMTLEDIFLEITEKNDEDDENKQNEDDDDKGGDEHENDN